MPFVLISDMAFFLPKGISPVKGGGDLIAYLREDRPHKFLLFVAACIPPAIMVYTFYADALEKAQPPPPSVTYFESWPTGRTRAESLDNILKQQVIKDKWLAEQRRAYSDIGRATGIDVDKIEREAAQERAAAAAKKKAELIASVAAEKPDAARVAQPTGTPQ